MANVKELIEELNKIEDKNLEVHMEGCDCYQDWSGKIQVEEGYLLMTKQD